ncbi:hypothetical protein PQX77_002971 [Marasmius sp. AFHP31]|nr:hypothetical protein PQX77_002971 [Marasmius sp. AFHP31]
MWRDALVALDKRARSLDHEKQAGSVKLVSEVQTALRNLPWSGNIKGFEDFDETVKVTSYCTNAWLATIHEHQLIELLREDLQLTPTSPTLIADTYHPQKLADAYYDAQSYMTKKAYGWLRAQGQELATGLRDSMCTIANIGSNHWVALAIDFRKEQVYYGDSLGGKIDSELRQSYDWWIRQHTDTEADFKWIPMSITEQQDGFSCGIFAANALAHHLDSTGHPLLAPEDAVEKRLEILLPVVRRHIDENVAKGFDFTFRFHLDSDSSDIEEQSEDNAQSPPLTQEWDIDDDYETMSVDYSGYTDDDVLLNETEEVGEPYNGQDSEHDITMESNDHNIDDDGGSDSAFTKGEEGTPLVQKKKVEDAARQAWNDFEAGGSRPPLFKYFKRETPEERAETIRQEDESRREKAEMEVAEKAKKVAEKAEAKKEDAKIRQQQCRARKRICEIEKGERDSLGRKRKVSKENMAAGHMTDQD